METHIQGPYIPGVTLACMGSEEGPGKGRCSQGPARTVDQDPPPPAPPSSRHFLRCALCPSHPLPAGSMASDGSWQDPSPLKLSPSFPPKQDGEEALAQPCEVLLWTSQPGLGAGVPLDHCSSCPVRDSVPGRQGLPGRGPGASEKGGRGFQKGGRGLRGKGAGASRKGRQGLDGKEARAHFACHLGRTVRASRFGSSTLKRWEASPPSLSRQLFSSRHLHRRSLFLALQETDVHVNPP